MSSCPWESTVSEVPSIPLPFSSLHPIPFCLCVFVWMCVCVCVHVCPRYGHETLVVTAWLGTLCVPLWTTCGTDPVPKKPHNQCSWLAKQISNVPLYTGPEPKQCRFRLSVSFSELAGAFLTTSLWLSQNFYLQLCFSTTFLHSHCFSTFSLAALLGPMGSFFFPMRVRVSVQLWPVLIES